MFQGAGSPGKKVEKEEEKVEEEIDAGVGGFFGDDDDGW